MAYHRNKPRKRTQSSYHSNDNIEQLFQESSLAQHYHRDSTLDQAPRSKRLYQEVMKEQLFLRNCRTVWVNKLECLKEDAQLFEKMKKCRKLDLVDVPPLFDRHTEFHRPEESTSQEQQQQQQQQQEPSTTVNTSDDDEDTSLSLNKEHETDDDEDTSLPLNREHETNEIDEEDSPQKELPPDIDLSMLEEEVDENDDHAVRRALDLMLKQFGDSL